MDRFKQSAPFLIFLIALGFNIHLRLFPAYFPQLKQRARLNIEDRLLKQAEQFVQSQYPNFSPRIKERIIKGIVGDRKRYYPELKKEIQQEYQRLKGQYQNSVGQTYLLEVDPYCRLRFTRLILENGYPGNKKTEGEIYDTFMHAPRGSLVPAHRFLYYFSAYLYRAYCLIFPDITLEKFVFYLPVFFTGLFCLVIFLFCRHFFSNLAGAFAVFFIGLSPVFIHRSSAGWFDQDVFNVLFPICIVWALSAALSKTTFISIVKYSLLSSLILGLYAFSWVGWWFIYVVIIVFFLSVLFNNFCLYFRDKSLLLKKSTPYLIALTIFSAGAVIFCLSIANLEPFSSLYNSLKENLRLGSSLSVSIWPSVLYTVSELRSGSFKSIPVYTGGWSIFMLSLLSLLWIYLREKRGKKADVVILLTYWTFIMFFASLKGLRFTQFLFVPLGIFLSVALGEILGLIFSWPRVFPKPWLGRAAALAVAGLICLVVSLPLRRGFSQASIQFPLINDSWYEFMQKIKNQTPENAIINSWWDYGNWFKEIARRPTIVDPQIQDAPITYWMARAFLAESEEESIRILRMVNNSSDALFKEINAFLRDEFVTISFLNQVLTSPRKELSSVFKAYRIPEGLARKIEAAIFIKTPPPAYLFIDESMIYKMTAISFLGNWNFAKVYIVRNRKLAKDELTKRLSFIFKLSAGEAEDLYEEVKLSGNSQEINELVSQKWAFPLYLASGRENAGVVYFDNGIIFRLDNFQAKMFDSREQHFKDLKFTFVFDGNSYIYNASTDEQVLYFKSGGLFFKSGNQWKCIGVSDTSLGRSLFSKLYFAKAKPLKFFEPFVMDEQANLYAFRIKWKD